MRHRDVGLLRVYELEKERQDGQVRPASLHVAINLNAVPPPAEKALYLDGDPQLAVQVHPSHPKMGSQRSLTRAFRYTGLGLARDSEWGFHVQLLRKGEPTL